MPTTPCFPYLPDATSKLLLVEIHGLHPGPPGQFSGGQRLAVGQGGEHRGSCGIPEQRRYRREVAIPGT